MLNIIALLASFENLTPMNWDVILPALNFLWQGMLAIFVVIGLIIVSVKITAYAIAKSDEAKQNKQNETDENSNS